MGVPAWQLLERLGAKESADLIYRYGEERLSRRISRQIVERRDRSGAYRGTTGRPGAAYCAPGGGATAGGSIRRRRQSSGPGIATNRELESLELALHRFAELLRPGGRLAVISFHSLEDRLVKTAFRDDRGGIR